LRLEDDELSLVDGDNFDVGRPLQIDMGTGSEMDPVFKGEIVGLELRPSQNGVSTLVVRGYDRSHRLHRGRQTRSFVQVTDSDVATRIAREVGLQPDVESTSEVYEYVLQDNRSNYEFLRERAERIGFAFWVDDDKLCFRRPAASPPSPITLEWGPSLSHFHPILSAGRQVDEVIVRGWDPQQKRAIVGRATSGRGTPEIGVQQSGGDLAKDAFGQAKAVVVQQPVATQAEADALAQSLCDELSNAFVQAEGRAGGMPNLRPGQRLDIRNVGQRFSGKYYVTAAVHTIGNRAAYETAFTVRGTQAQTLLDAVQPELEERESICVGIVTNNNDPDGLGRVKVKFPWLGDDVESTWARIASPMAGQDRGFFYLPEVNDEVLVAFEHGDVNHAYVLGALWNGQDKPPKASEAVSGSGSVVKRIICTRVGHTIILDDTDGGGGITIEDKSGNKIVIESASNAMQIEVGGDLTIKAQGSVSIEGTAGVEIKSSAQTSVEGSAGVKVESSATVDVKGAMVNLN
jgi:phage protein D/phage baseplate assembly protein gpV